MSEVSTREIQSQRNVWLSRFGNSFQVANDTEDLATSQATASRTSISQSEDSIIIKYDRRKVFRPLQMALWAEPSFHSYLHDEANYLFSPRRPTSNARQAFCHLVGESKHYLQRPTFSRFPIQVYPGHHQTGYST